MKITKETSFETILMIRDLEFYQRIKLYKEGIFEIPTSCVIRVHKNHRFFPQCPEGYELKENYANVKVTFDSYNIINDSFVIDDELFYMTNKERTSSPMEELFKKIKDV